MDKLRIQKFLSRMGVASRRASEELVEEGRVQINGTTVRELPVFVDPDVDTVSVDGKALPRPESMREGRVYVLLNKPRGVVCTQSDPEGRPRAVDLVPNMGKRVYCVGRLDMESTGLIVLTNDGELTEHLTHPRYEVVKTYVVEIPTQVAGDDIETIKAGVYIDGKRTQRSGVKVLKRNRDRTLLEIRLTEGRNREIRRMLAGCGYKVRRLHRKAIGPITDRGLKIGSHRPMSPPEVDALRNAGTEPGKPAARRGRKKTHRRRNRGKN
ncbi:MAG: pseudouridine synthase [Planctomycetota bacterium]